MKKNLTGRSEAVSRPVRVRKVGGSIPPAPTHCLKPCQDCAPSGWEFALGWMREHIEAGGLDLRHFRYHAASMKGEEENG